MAVAIVGSGCLVIGALFLIRQKSIVPSTAPVTKTALAAARQSDHPVDSAPPPTATNFAKLSVPPEVSNIGGVSSNTAEITGSPQTAPNDAAKGRHEDYVRRRISTLEDLAMDNDSSSLDVILSELTNADPQIRKAALEATIQFASRDAIPKLAEVASQTDDPQEKIALKDAIEFLKLPSLTEVLAANKAAQPAQPVKPFVKAAHPLPPAARLPGPASQ